MIDRLTFDKPVTILQNRILWRNYFLLYCCQILCCYFPVQAQSPDTLSQYFTPVPLQNPDSAWHVLKPNLKGKKLFLFGEAHGVACNKPLQLSLLKYLHKHANVRNLLLEVSPSEGFLYDHYLRTGEKKYLVTTAYGDFVEDRQFWDSLYLFNKQQPLSQKISVFGIDKADHLNFVQAMKVVLWGKLQPQDSLPYEFERVNNQLIRCVTKLKGFKKLRRLLKKDFVKQPNVYEDYLKDDFWYFQYIINNILYRYNDKKRDFKMYQNTLHIHTKFKKGNFFGVLGEYHVNSLKRASTLHKHISDNHLFQKKIFTLHTHYINTKLFSDGKLILYKNIGFFIKSGYLEQENLIKLLQRNMVSPVSLIPLRKILNRMNFYDYLLYIKNQNSVTFKPLYKYKK